MVMVGAAMHLLPIRPEILESAVRAIFGRKGEDVVNVNLRALRAGREAARQVKGQQS